ncbi:MAG: dockerin type I repeat-containing protein, partial [Acutalibacteraceae bacterium]
RQEDAGKFFDDNGSLNKKQGIVAITKSGITVASGNEISDDLIAGIQTNFESVLPDVVKISVKLVESSLNIRIASSDGTELFNNNYTVNYNRAGYLAFGVSASSHYFADISLTHLNSDGSTIGLNLSDLVTGDLNDDGKVNASDLITMKQALLSGTQLGIDIIDLTGNGTFDVVDLVRLKKLMAEYL